MNTLRIFPLQGHRKDIHDIAEQLTEALPKDIYDAYLKGVDENGKLAFYFSRNCAWGVIDTRNFARVEFHASSHYGNNTTLYVNSKEELDAFYKGNTILFDKIIKARTIK